MTIALLILVEHDLRANALRLSVKGPFPDRALLNAFHRRRLPRSLADRQDRRRLGFRPVQAHSQQHWPVWRGQPVGVFAGTRQDLAAIEITEVQPLPDQVVVMYHEIPLGPTMGIAAPDNRPYHLRLIPKTSLPIRFKKM